MNAGVVIHIYKHAHMHTNSHIIYTHICTTITHIQTHMYTYVQTHACACMQSDKSVFFKPLAAFLVENIHVK